MIGMNARPSVALRSQPRQTRKDAGETLATSSTSQSEARHSPFGQQSPIKSLHLIELGAKRSTWWNELRKKSRLKKVNAEGGDCRASNSWDLPKSLFPSFASDGPFNSPLGPKPGVSN